MEICAVRTYAFIQLLFLLTAGSQLSLPLDLSSMLLHHQENFHRDATIKTRCEKSEREKEKVKEKEIFNLYFKRKEYNKNVMCDEFSYLRRNNEESDDGTVTEKRFWMVYRWDFTNMFIYLQLFVSQLVMTYLLVDYIKYQEISSHRAK